MFRPLASPEAVEPLEEFNRHVSISLLWDQGSSVFPAGLNHSQVGPPWRDMTGLTPCPEKQKTNPQAQLCHRWGRGVGRMVLVNPILRPPSTHQGLAVLGESCPVLLRGGPDLEQAVLQDK